MIGPMTYLDQLQKQPVKCADLLTTMGDSYMLHSTTVVNVRII